MTDSSADDIAYVRQLSESGAHAPLTGGRFMAWWGLLVALGWTAQHFALNGQLGENPDGRIFGMIWGAFGIVGAIGQVVLDRTMPPMAGAGSAGNRASNSVWTAGAFSILSMVAGVGVLAGTGYGYMVFDWIVPVAFAVYACALIVTGKLAGDRIVVSAGYGAVIMVGLFTAAIMHADRYLLAAAGAVFTMLLPGLLLVRREPKAAE
ncbi:MAG TPA: hypothetical protein VIT38_10880 [Allosphingosinicella sp.]|jgi:hypothetical protein